MVVVGVGGGEEEREGGRGVCSYVCLCRRKAWWGGFSEVGEVCGEESVVAMRVSGDVEVLYRHEGSR